jgi:hypothetical protein
VRAGTVQFFDDVGDGVADARDFLKPILPDQRVQRFGQCQQAVRRPWNLVAAGRSTQ